MNKELVKLDEHIHTLKEAGYTNIHVSNVQRQSGGTMGPYKNRGYMVTIYFEKPKEAKCF